jgi:predicted heme/steroid binding protein
LYGPNGAYGVMAGHDASRAMAKRSLSVEQLNGPVDDLCEEERKVLEHYVRLFRSKYKAVAQISLPTADSWTPALASTSLKPMPGFAAEGTFSLDSLGKQLQDGGGKKRLLALNGIVYDVSLDHHRFGPGGRFEALVGVDASLALAKGDLNPALFNRDVCSLSYEETRTLHMFVKIFEQQYPRVGALVEGGTSTLLRPSGPSHGNNTPLHLAVERSDAKKVSYVCHSCCILCA